MFLADQITLDSRTVRETRDGYLVAEARVARTGIQTYTAGELGLTDRAASDVIRVYRSPEEVFDKASMESFTWRPVTMDHPSQMVTADSWKAVSVGMTGDRAKREVADDGEYLVVPLTLMDRKAIDEYHAGKRQLSNGYQCELDHTPGTVPASDRFHAGQAFDARQVGMRGNHTAFCDAARGGSKLAFGDALPVDAARSLFQSMLDSQGDQAVSTKKITRDAFEIEVTDAAERYIVKLEGQIADAVKAKDAADAEVVKLKAEAVAKDAEIVKLKADVAAAAITPAKLRDAGKAYALVVSKAKALGVTVGDDDDQAAIMRKVVDASMKDVKDEHLQVAFDALTKDVKAEDGDDLRGVIRGAHAPTTPDKVVLDAYSQMVEDLKSPNKKAA